MSQKRKQPFTQELLAEALPSSAAQHIFNDKIAHRPFLLRPSTVDERDSRRSAREEKRKQRKKPLKPKPLSARQRRRMGLYDVPRTAQKYATFLPLHRLWLGYVREVLGEEVYTGGVGAAAKLASADVHGAEVEVVRSACPGRVGIKGIVVKDTQFVFEIITPKNKLKMVPKEGTVFRVAVPIAGTDVNREKGAIDKVTDAGNSGPTAASLALSEGQSAETECPTMFFEIHGNQFMFRAVDRASKKMKPHFMKNI